MKLLGQGVTYASRSAAIPWYQSLSAAVDRDMEEENWQGEMWGYSPSDENGASRIRHCFARSGTKNMTIE